MISPNGNHTLLPQGRLDSPNYYNYSPQDQHGSMLQMHPVTMTNGQSSLSPAGDSYSKFLF